MSPPLLRSLVALALATVAAILHAQQRANPYEREYPSVIAPPEPIGDPNMALTPLTRTGEFASDMHQDMRRPDTPELATDNRLPVFFPPVVSPLFRPVQRDQPPTGRGRFIPAVVLSQFVNEPFYAPLSTLLAFKSMNPRLQSRLDEYCATKFKLETELQAVLATVRDQPAAARRQRLAAFAAEQAPKLVQLEKVAEELREECVSRGTDWNEKRTWRLGDPRDASMPVSAAFQVVRAASFYQKGLSPAHRRLLREIALELQSPVASANAAPVTLSFFSPDTARWQVPADLPPALAAQLAAYDGEKAALRKELFDAIYRNDRTPFESRRAAALRALGEQHAVRLAALERRAEEIRVELSALPDFLPPAAAPDAPPELATQLTAYFAKRRELSRLAPATREQMRRLLGLDGMMPAMPVVADSPAARGGKAAVPSGKAERVREIMANYQRDFTAGTDELARLKSEMRTTTAKLRATEIARSGKTADALLSEIMRSWWIFEETESYRDYRTAMFEPGLSPEQRRLLFDVALIRLEQPLPGGDLQPR